MNYGKFFFWELSIESAYLCNEIEEKVELVGLRFIEFNVYRNCVKSS